MLCYVRYVMSGHVTSCYVKLCYVTFMSQCVMPSYVMSCYVTIHHVMLHYVILRYMLLYVMLSHVTLHYIVLCYVIWLMSVVPICYQAKLKMLSQCRKKTWTTWSQKARGGKLIMVCLLFLTWRLSCFFLGFFNWFEAAYWPKIKQHFHLKTVKWPWQVLHLAVGLLR